MSSLVSLLLFFPLLSILRLLSFPFVINIYLSLFTFFTFLFVSPSFHAFTNFLWFHVICFSLPPFFVVITLSLHIFLQLLSPSLSLFLSLTFILSLRSRTERPGARVRLAFSVRCHSNHQDGSAVSHGYLPRQRKQRRSHGQRWQSHAVGAQSSYRQGCCQP